jgi:hypothetical protein
MPSPHIIDSGDPFQLQVRIRTALAGVGYELPGPFFVNFHVHELDGGAAAGSPFAGTDPPNSMATPAGDSGPAGSFDEVRWFESTTSNINLPSGTYRITVHGHHPGAGLMFVHDGAIVHIGA